ERCDEAVAVWDNLLATSRSQMFLYQRRLTMSDGRRFRDAMAGSEELEGDRSDRLRANVAYYHGLPEALIGAHRRRWEERLATGQTREAYEANGEWLYKRAFFRGDVTVDEIDRLILYGEDVGYADPIRYGLLSRVFANPLDPEAAGWVDRLCALHRAEVPGPSAEEKWAETCLAWVLEDYARLAAIAKTIDDWPGAHANWIPMEVLLNHLGQAVAYEPAQWLEPFEDVERRWVGHWRNWYARVTA
ncbi:MAG: hypothetical protein LBD70_00080, partial [Bifidobacteriaceae bacterium]|nr:hypothetical protein [Bifidobacteriaceae bacterium]